MAAFPFRILKSGFHVEADAVGVRKLRLIVLFTDALACFKQVSGWNLRLEGASKLVLIYLSFNLEHGFKPSVSELRYHCSMIVTQVCVSVEMGCVARGSGHGFADRDAEKYQGCGTTEIRAPGPDRKTTGTVRYRRKWLQKRDVSR